MAKIKITYSSGRYLLTKPDGKEEYIYLTKTQAKVLMKDSLYNRLGFKSIELEERID